jgi:spermidine synthase
MSARFEEIAYAATPMGELVLRRRVEPTLGVDVYEVRLGEEYLMTSLFTASEEALARLGLALLDGDGPFDVVVGGLGLGWTARTALEDARVGSLVVVDALPEVIRWHHERLVPGSTKLVDDPRCRLVEGDFFAMAAADGFDPEQPGRVLDAVLVDIDHTPDHTLHASHGAFYTADGLRAMTRFLRPGGVFGLWSDDPPEESFLAVMREVLDDVHGEVVDFPNPLTGGRSACSVYLGRTRGQRLPVPPAGGTVGE